MIQYKKGNLLDSPDKYIMHGVNCQGVMGSGVAKAIRVKWPKVYDEYIELEYSEGYFLGDIQYVDVGSIIEPKIVINAFTQQYYGRDGRRYVSYDAIDTCFKSVTTFTKEPISVSKIGSSLGGGDWNVIKSIIEQYSDNDITVWELDY